MGWMMLYFVHPIKEVYSEATQIIDQYLYQLTGETSGGWERLHHPLKQINMLSKGKMMHSVHWEEQEGKYKQGEMTRM